MTHEQVRGKCDTCPVRRETEDQLAEDNTSDEFAGFIRSAMQSFGIDPDAWLEEQDRLDLEQAEGPNRTMLARAQLPGALSVRKSGQPLDEPPLVDGN